MKRNKQVTALGVICALAVLLIPVPAQAYDPREPLSDFEGRSSTGTGLTTYYDVYGAGGSRPGLDEDLNALYKDAVLNRDNLRNWSHLGYDILRNGGNKDAYWDHTGVGFDASFDETDPTLIDIVGTWNKEGNLKYATSLSEVEKAARERVKGYFTNKNFSASDFEGIPEWKNDTRPQTVYYTDAFKAKAYTSNTQRYYNYFGLAFYDFKVSLLADENLKYNWASDGYPDIKTAYEAGEEGVYWNSVPTTSYSTGVTNNSAETAQVTQTLSSVQEQTISNTVSHSNTTSWDVMVGASISFGHDAPGTGGKELWGEIRVDADYGEIYESAYSDTTENTFSQSQSSSVSVPLPPYTAVRLENQGGTSKAWVDYDAPFVVTYKVAVYSLCGHVYWDGLVGIDVQHTDHSLATFGKDNESGTNAVDNLKNRITNYQKLGPSYEDTYGDKLNWTNMYYGGTARARTKDSVDWLVSHKPMSVTGATLTYDTTGTAYQIDSIQPTYPLTSVSAGTKELQLSPGARYGMSEIALTGQNRFNAPYYGFDAEYGHWIMLDEQGSEIDTSDIATLQTDPVTRQVFLRAGTTAGSVYLKYVIDEDRYTYGNGKPFTRNQDLQRTAIVMVEVTQQLTGTPPLQSKVVMLTQEVNNSNGPAIKPSLRKSLVTKLTRAVESYEKGNIQAAAKQVTAARNEIARKSGKGIPTATAERWVHVLDAISTYLASQQTPKPGRR